MEVSGNAQPPADPSGFRVCFAQPLESEASQHPEDDDEEEDRDSVAEPPVLDETFTRLINFIYDSLLMPVLSLMRPLLLVVTLRSILLFLILRLLRVRILRSTPGCRKLLTLAQIKHPV